MCMVTIVVPVYNISNYIENCVDSILRQTYRNFELILVNDGSTDGSSIICKRYCKKDGRVKLINKDNGGLSSARNSGIDHAHGKFIIFIDGDDWIDEDYVQKLVDAITKTRSSIAVFHMKKELKNEAYATRDMKCEWTKFTGYQALKELFTNNNIGYSACNKIYDIDLFDSIRYPVGKLMEDKATTYKLIDKAKKGVVVSSSEKYHYYMRPSSIIKSTFSKKNFDSFKIHDDILSFIKSRHNELLPLVRKRYVYEAFRMLMALIESGNSDINNYKRCTDIIVSHRESILGESIPYRMLIKVVGVSPYVPYMIGKVRIIRYLLKRMELH